MVGALKWASRELKNNKEIIIKATANDTNACRFSLLDGYQNFDEILEKEGESFFFSCWNNRNWDITLEITNHINFLPTLDQIEFILKNTDNEITQIYRLRKDEWLAKMEENKLKNTLR